MSDHLPEELLSAMLDGELSPVEQAELERRLQASIELQEELEALRDVSQQMRMLPRPYAPPELRREILEEIQRKRTPVQAVPQGTSLRWNWRRMAGWGAVGVAASLLLLAGWSLNQPADQKPLLATNDENRDAIPAIAVAPAASSGTEFQMAARESGSPLMAPPESPSVTLRKAAPAPLPAESVQIVNVSRDEIRRKIDELNRRPQRGNSIRVPGSLKEQNGETPIVVVFTVVDVMEAMNQMQVLVRQQQIRSADNQVLSVLPAEPQDRTLTAVTVELEMDGPEMAAILNSVAAFDAIMYVEKGATPDSDRSADETDALAVRRSPDLASRNAGRSRQRQFNFQQLAEPSEEKQMESKIPAAQAIAGGGLSRNSPEARNPEAASPALSPPLDPSAPNQPGFPLKPMSERSLPTTSGWEDARKFRAFILLKKQTDGVRKSEDRSPP